MVDRHRLLVAALVVAIGVGLYALGSGPPSFGGTVSPDAPPVADVSIARADAEPGTVTVRFAGTGAWASVTLAVDWNASLRVVEGDRRLERVGDTVTLEETGDEGSGGGGETAVVLTVTATGDGQSGVVYRKTVRL